VTVSWSHLDERTDILPYQGSALIYIFKSPSYELNDVNTEYGKFTRSGGPRFDSNIWGIDGMVGPAVYKVSKMLIMPSYLDCRGSD
jgi:hypothetical protein